MDGLRTEKRAARESGLSISQVRKLASNEGIGTEVAGTGKFLFTKEDVVALSEYISPVDEGVPCYQNRKWLHDRYWKKGKTTREMGVEAGVHHTTVLRWMGRLGVSVRE